MEPSLANAVIAELEATTEYLVLRRVAQQLDQPTDEVIQDLAEVKRVAFVDIEATGLDPRQDEIIELGSLIVSYHPARGFFEVVYQDSQLQEPKNPISAEITAITGITNEAVAGQHIDWAETYEHYSAVDLIICHNAAFDRNMLECQTPERFQQLIKAKAFGCSARDVAWRELGFEGNKLEYLNMKMGYFYGGHRALVDCWATLNLFQQRPEAFTQLQQRVNATQYLLCAVNAPFDKKDLLKQRGYRWSTGASELPKCWWTTINATDHEEELMYLKETIYNGREVQLPQQTITATNRYSYRAESLSS